MDYSNEELIKQLRLIAKTIIKTYIQDKYKNMPNIEEKLARIDNVIENFPIILVEKKLGGSRRGCTIENRIALEVNDYGKMAIAIVHEFFHLISAQNKEDYCGFVEEAYVSFATSEAIRNILTKSNEEFKKLFKECRIENLRELIANSSLENAYKIESSVIRCNDIILKNTLGIDSIYEYIFNENGYSRLIELAKDVSPEYGAFIRKIKR